MSLGKMQPKTQYVRSGDVHIAYQVVGQGPLDIVYVPGWLSHVELSWELPDLALGFERLASCARLILFDKRGWPRRPSQMRSWSPGRSGTPSQIRRLFSPITAFGC